MTNNDTLHLISQALDLDSAALLSLYPKPHANVDETRIAAWLKKEGDPGHEACSDQNLIRLLNGLIDHKRGPRDGGPRAPEHILNNNVVFMKLKIALNLQADDILQTLARHKIQMSKHELSALFRNRDHKHYRECLDPLLRAFIEGLKTTIKQ
jgi:uncharacterized protein YehS (DUF1456 family)